MAALFRLENIGRLEGTLERLQRASGKVIGDISSFIENASFLDGKLITIKNGGNGTFDVVHGLNRVPRGFIVLYLERAAGATADISIYYRQEEVKNEARMTLYATESFKELKLWVY